MSDLRSTPGIAVQRLDGNVEESLSTDSRGTSANLTSCTKIKRVGVYCRVSTDMESQQSSLELQISSFRDQISKNPGWELVDIYADEGISGGSVRRRKEFQRMMKDSMNGKLDYIITKSISRFARNTLECLTYVRELQKYGTQIYFEKEKIDTGTTFSEMLLTILAAFAQEESRSISENAKWGIRKRFEAGQEKRTNVFGYRFDNEHNYIIEPKEADTVRRIFELYETGRYSMDRIAKKLIEEKRASAHCDNWNASHVHVILNNEKYIGDVLMQKKYTVDHLTHKEKRNTDRILPQFYVKDHHIPIIDRKQYERCKRIAELKNTHGKSNQYPYGDLIICPICGKRMQKHKVLRQDKDAWHCDRLGGCGRYVLLNRYIDEAVLDAYRKVDVEEIRKLIEVDDAEKRDAAKKFFEMKHRIPFFYRVDFYWLDELVEYITVEKEYELIVYWKCGMKTSARMAIRSQKYDPINLAKVTSSVP